MRKINPHSHLLTRRFREKAKKVGLPGGLLPRTRLLRPALHIWTRNFATNIQGGAKFGYELLWVILGSNLMAMFLQSLSAKLGIATGQNLAEHCRNQYSHRVVISMWVIGELVAIATDLAEFLGAALGS